MSLLAPQDRNFLLESLRPPEDYQLDLAIGTTYSLDLLAMMVAPVGFTLFEVDPNDPVFLQQDPLEILEAIRRHASQIVIFCEAGRIAVPRHHRPLFAYLEERIVQAKAPTKGYSFHPKVWIIRYVNSAHKVWYRLLCLSRNLTFDRSWDTILTLDGMLRDDREVGFSLNRPLTEFLAALPTLTVSKVSPDIRGQVGKAQREIGRVEWDLESLPFENLAFWPLGHDGKNSWPFKGRAERMLVVSPFLGDKALEKLATGGGDNVLIGRRECIDTVSEETLKRFNSCYQLSNQSTIGEPEDGEMLPGSEPPLQGLHAKLYVADAGWNARIWTGSANATTSAFEGNIEFLVELTGKKSKVGVEAFLEKVQGISNFSDLLEPYQRPTFLERNTELELLERELDDFRMPIASAEWTISVEQGLNPEEYTPTARSKVTLPKWGSHISVTCRLLSLNELSKRVLSPGASAEVPFTGVAVESLTSFLVIEVLGQNAAGARGCQFVVNALLIGSPANRRERILQHMLRDRRSLLRFLLLLLADMSADASLAAAGESHAWVTSGAEAPSEALLEPLLRALDRSPGRLNAIESLLKELQSTEDGRKLLPDGLIDLFTSIWAAKETSAS